MYIMMSVNRITNACNNKTSPGMSESQSCDSVSNNHLVPKNRATSATSHRALYFESVTVQPGNQTQVPLLSSV